MAGGRMIRTSVNCPLIHTISPKAQSGPAQSEYVNPTYGFAHHKGRSPAAAALRLQVLQSIALFGDEWTLADPCKPGELRYRAAVGRRYVELHDVSGAAPKGGRVLHSAG